MKVKVTAESKKILTLSDMPKVKEIIEDMKEDTDTNFWAQLAAKIASDHGGEFEILKFEAEISKNCRVWNWLCDGSGNLDIWFRIYALNRYDGFYVIGAYYSDLCTSDGENAEEIRSNMYIDKYKAER